MLLVLRGVFRVEELLNKLGLVLPLLLDFEIGKLSDGGHLPFDLVVVLVELALDIFEPDLPHLAHGIL